jgi:hypothetical protein
MSALNNEDELSDEETERRRDAALLRALSTPHKKQSEMKIGKRRRGPDDGKVAAALKELDALSLRIGTHTGQHLLGLLNVVAKEPESLIVIKWRSEPARGANGLRMVFEPSARFEELLAALRVRANELNVGPVHIL